MLRRQITIQFRCRDAGKFTIHIAFMCGHNELPVKLLWLLGHNVAIVFSIGLRTSRDFSSNKYNSTVNWENMIKLARNS